MTILMTLIIAVLAVFIGKQLLSVSQKKEMRPIRIKTDEQRFKNRRR
ncbi:hypothetical protein SAMN05216175_108105 [Neptunomonas qingdaonensis]|uniref:Uncharacterized protein n=1 Tax=Neptunomonas qingdaonensis TaxID=1045558 RepID=A0A1I2SX02_9GAMM|nr:hypothetical protein SAMN05216175_108105 [Neptunomonas qingdaonensis]